MAGMRGINKQKIAQSFGQAALTYHAHAQLQQDCAAQLLEILAEWSTDLPLGTVLEVGCGTGFLTQGLSDRNAPWNENRLSPRLLLATDLSSEMVQFCQSHLPPCDFVSFQQMDGENITGTHALIVASFVIQWFEQPGVALRGWLERLEAGGLIGLAFPTSRSFPEWRNVCDRLQIPFTANSLPNPQDLIQELSANAQIFCLKEMILTTTHRNATDFFRDLKSIGAGVNTAGQTLSLGQMKKLIQAWDSLNHSGVCVVQHHVVFWVIGRSPNDTSSKK
jgi:malonyl-CoA O-methyltransferase